MEGDGEPSVSFNPNAVAGAASPLILADTAYTSQWQAQGTQTFVSTLTANQLHIRVVNIPIACTITGVMCLNENAVAGNVRGVMYDILGTTQYGASGSTAQTPTFGPTLLPFTGGVVRIAPGSYCIGAITDNATGRYVLATFTDLPSSVVAPGSFTIPSTITPPSATTRQVSSLVVSTY